MGGYRWLCVAMGGYRWLRVARFSYGWLRWLCGVCVTMCG